MHILYKPGNQHWLKNPLGLAWKIQRANRTHASQDTFGAILAYASNPRAHKSRPVTSSIIWDGERERAVLNLPECTLILVSFSTLTVGLLNTILMRFSLHVMATYLKWFTEITGPKVPAQSNSAVYVIPHYEASSVCVCVWSWITLNFVSLKCQNGFGRSLQSNNFIKFILAWFLNCIERVFRDFTLPYPLLQLTFFFFLFLNKIVVLWKSVQYKTLMPFKHHKYS